MTNKQVIKQKDENEMWEEEAKSEKLRMMKPEAINELEPSKEI